MGAFAGTIAVVTCLGCLCRGVLWKYEGDRVGGVMGKLIHRIEREAGVPNLTEILATRVTPTDLQSILLEVLRRRAAGVTPSAVLSNYEANRFVRPSPISPTRFLEWEQIAFSCLPPEFQPLALAPVTPLGTVSALAGVDQNWAVSTVRNTEVVSDSTNVLALECAHRRQQLLRADPKSPEQVHLATSHRLLRAQYYSGPHQVAHFGSFALCSAGRDLGRLQFEISTMVLHVRFYLTALRDYLGDGARLRVTMSDFGPNPRHEVLEEQILFPIRSKFADVDCRLDPGRTRGRGYYIDLVFHIDALSHSGEWLELVDGGTVNWSQRLLSNAKERLLISGIGSERLCGAFPGVDAD